uniref:Uncharacterized protein n=1 Tax=Oryza punctata TaxID=4537 RepID=A0A0E0LGE5_ORYPU
MHGRVVVQKQNKLSHASRGDLYDINHLLELFRISMSSSIGRDSSSLGTVEFRQSKAVASRSSILSSL